MCMCLCLSTAVRRGKMRSSCVAGPVAARTAAVAIFNLDLKFPELIQMGQLRLYINANIVRKHFLPLLV